MRARHIWSVAAVVGTLLMATVDASAATKVAPGSPVVDSVAPVWTNHGTIVRVAAEGAAGVNSVHVLAYPEFSNSPAIPLGPFTLVSGTATSGVWETTSPLGLPQGVYALGADVVDVNGADSPVAGSPNTLDYAPGPAAHITSVSPDRLDHSGEQVTVVGRFTTYDPASGYLDTPYLGPVRVTLAAPGGVGAWAPSNPTDGSFTVSLTPGPGWTGQPLQLRPRYSVGNMDLRVAPDTAVPVQAVPGGTPTRIILDPAGTQQFVRGTYQQVTGRIEFFDHDGAWRPLPRTWVDLDSGTGLGQPSRSDATGRFTLGATVPDSPTTWTVHPASAPHADLLLGSSTASFPLASVAQRIDLSLTNAAVNWLSQFSAWDTHSSTDGHYPGSRIYLQESADGHSGWRTVATIRTTANGTRAISVPVNNPHGWYRTYSPATPGYGAAYSNAVPGGLYEGLVTGGRPRTTVVRRNGWLTVTGTLWRRGATGGWVRCPAHVPVVLTSRGAGFDEWSLNAFTYTDAHGNFSIRVRDYDSLFWRVWDQDPRGVLTYGPQTFVRVR